MSANVNGRSGRIIEEFKGSTIHAQISILEKTVSEISQAYDEIKDNFPNSAALNVLYKEREKKRIELQTLNETKYIIK